MRYMKCRCGKHEAWTTMGSPACRGCDVCGVTLAEGPEGHRTPEPHQWQEEWTIDPQTGERGKKRFCMTCNKHEVLPYSEPLSVYEQDIANGFKIRPPTTALDEAAVALANLAKLEKDRHPDAGDINTVLRDNGPVPEIIRSVSGDTGETAAAPTPEDTKR